MCFNYEENTAKSRAISHALREAYFVFDDIDVRSFHPLGHLFADSRIGYAVHRLVHLISNVTDVYYYKFSYVGRFSLFHYPQNSPYGVHHGDDPQYIFSVDYLSPLILPTDPEHFMIERMTTIWESFAHTG